VNVNLGYSLCFVESCWKLLLLQITSNDPIKRQTDTLKQQKAALNTQLNALKVQKARQSLQSAEDAQAAPQSDEKPAI
jgi:ABC-type phosphate transport system auxiliary subunit